MTHQGPRGLDRQVIHQLKTILKENKKILNFPCEVSHSLPIQSEGLSLAFPSCT